jgi:glycosyltransferase involved in cell wall biosynthesis
VVINTLNEERRLPYALRSVQDWVDEIVVVDMHSDDKTVEIAEAFGARIFTHERVGYADPARAFAFARATGDWILILDADELVPRASRGVCVTSRPEMKPMWWTFRS